MRDLPRLLISIAHCRGDLIPHVSHRPVKIRFAPPLVFFTHRLTHIYDIDRSLFVRHHVRSNFLYVGGMCGSEMERTNPIRHRMFEIELSSLLG